VTRVLIAFNTVHGNTKRVAELIAQGMKEGGVRDVTVVDMEKTDPRQAVNFDVILLGCPNHARRPTRAFSKFVDGMKKSGLTGKQITVFDTCMEGQFQVVMDKMEKQVAEKLPSSILLPPGLSIKVLGMKGPLADGEEAKCVSFGINLATRIRG
jgi:flavodoxin